MSSDIKLEALAPKDDLLPEEGTSFGVYYKSLSSAFSNPKIRNIALSGSLGSGKSSIIRSFDRERNGKKRFLYVSLIDFSRAVPSGEGKPYDQQQLEASLLDQILSYCTSDKVPESSIRGIPEKFEFLDFSAKALTLLGLSAFVLIFHEKFGKLAAMFGAPDNLRSNFHVMLYLFAAIVLCGFVYRILLRCLPLLQASRFLFKYGDAEAEVDLGKKRTSLDTHKFELAYILERIGEEHDYTVVFEDLERLDPATAVAIMAKLREINTLTNNHLQAQGNSQPIRFLYAISDSTMPAEYRTKFYDCIIPVIPVSHPLNSKVQLRKILETLGFSDEWKDHLCDALADAFVDYRTLLSMRNEFQVLQALYDAKSKHSNGSASTSAAQNAPFLFAITAYRILLPEWFEWTLSPQGDGILPDLGSDDDKTKFERSGRAKAYHSVRKLFDNGLLDKTSMRLIIGEQALIEQWLKVIRSALDKEIFDNGDERRIRSITEAVQVVFRDTHSPPSQDPYEEFREAMYARLCTLCNKKDRNQFILAANSLAAVSRADTANDWVWGPPESEIHLHLPWEFPIPSDFTGFLQNYLCWLDELSEAPEEHPYAIRCLKALCEYYPEYQENVLQCAEELLDSSGTPDRKTIVQMKNLWDTCPENTAVALQYAKALAKLAYEQELPECGETVALLKNLWKTFPDNQEIALRYAMGLFNLSNKQQLLERADTVALLKNLREEYPDNQEIALRYAKVLVNLSAEQQLPERAGTVALLKNLWEIFPGNQEIALQYTMVLVNLSAKQQLPELADTVALLKNLWEMFPENQEIAHQYAMGLFNFTANQELLECADTVALLKKLWETFPDDQKIAHQYAMGLVNLSANQELPERANTVTLLKNLRDAFQDNEEIAHQYAMGLFNLSNKQQLPELADTVALLKNLWKTFPDNQEIALRYAMGLFNLSNKQ